MGWLSMEEWSPYLVGIGIGILSWLTFLLSDQVGQNLNGSLTEVEQKLNET
jgi:hypothetical protein